MADGGKKMKGYSRVCFNSVEYNDVVKKPLRFSVPALIAMLVFLVISLIAGSLSPKAILIVIVVYHALIYLINWGLKGGLER